MKIAQTQQMLKLIYTLLLKKHFQFDPSNTFQKRLRQWQQRTSKVVIPKMPKQFTWLNISQLMRLTGNSWVPWLGIKRESEKFFICKGEGLITGLDDCDLQGRLCWFRQDIVKPHSGHESVALELKNPGTKLACLPVQLVTKWKSLTHYKTNYQKRDTVELQKSCIS